MRFVNKFFGFGVDVRAARFARLTWVLGGSVVLLICGSCCWLLALAMYAQTWVAGLGQFVR